MIHSSLTFQGSFAHRRHRANYHTQHSDQPATRWRRLGIRRWVGAGRQGGRDVVGRSGVLAEAGDGGGELGDLTGVLEVDREEAVVPGRPGAAA